MKVNDKKKHKWNNILSFMLACIGLLFISSCDLADIASNPTLELFPLDDITSDFGAEVVVQASARHSTGESIEFFWEITSKPGGSSLVLDNPNQSKLSVTPDILGIYKFRVVAESSDGLTESGTVSVQVIKAPVRLSGSIDNARTLDNVYDDPNDIDYLVSGVLTINAMVTIGKNVRIAFEKDAGLNIAPAGSLTAQGTASESIVMTGSEETKGFWKGVNFESRSSKNVMEYVTVAYGGSGGFDGFNRQGNITLKNAIVQIANCNLLNSGKYGLITTNENDELPSFKNNILSSNEYPVHCSKHHYNYFDGSSDFSQNDYNMIDSWGQDPLSKNVTWKKLNVPYRLAVKFEIIKSDLKIEPGVEFIGQPSSGIIIDQNGSLSAIGTSNEPIVFRGAENVAGFWIGITIRSNNTKNNLRFVTISNGGEMGFDGENLKANLLLESSARVSLENNTFSKSGGYGLITRNLPVVISKFSNNTITECFAPIKTFVNHFHYFDTASKLEGNQEDAILTWWANQATTVDATWVKTTVPYKLFRNDYIGSDITIMPGVEIIGMDLGGLEVRANGSLRAVGTAQAPIIFRGEQDVNGYWYGIQIRSNNPNNVIRHAEIANGGQYNGEDANIVIFENARVEVTNSIIRKGKFYGVLIRRNGIYVELNNTYENNPQGNIFKAP